MGILVSAIFILGLVAAAYSSADSALTSMTTSVCIDLIKIEKIKSKKRQESIRKKIHFIISLILILVILIFKYLIANESVISKLFLFAGYTYGPLLGLFSFGLFTNFKIYDKYVAFICVISPFVGYYLTEFLKTNFQFDLGFMILVLNGFLTFLGLFFLRKK
jgi:Na+/proline symporter